MPETSLPLQKFIRYVEQTFNTARYGHVLGTRVVETARCSTRSPHGGERDVVFESPEATFELETARIIGLAKTFTDLKNNLMKILKAVSNDQIPELAPFFVKSFESLSSKLISFEIIMAQNPEPVTNQERNEARKKLITALVSALSYLKELETYKDHLNGISIDEDLLAPYFDLFHDRIKDYTNVSINANRKKEPKPTHHIAERLREYLQATRMLSDSELFHRCDNLATILTNELQLEQHGDTYQKIRFNLYQSLISFLQNDTVSSDFLAELEKLPDGPKDITAFINPIIERDILDPLITRLLQALLALQIGTQKPGLSVDEAWNRIKQVVTWGKALGLSAKLSRTDINALTEQISNTPALDPNTQNRLLTEIHQFRT